MSLFGYSVKEEAKEIGTELKGSRNDLLLVGLGTLIGSIASSVIGTSGIFNRLKDWYEGRSDYDEEE
jgi:hypothetical protein